MRIGGVIALLHDQTAISSFAHVVSRTDCDLFGYTGSTRGPGGGFDGGGSRR